MDKFCSITPDRGDRPELYEFCKHQISRMTIKPFHSYFIDYKPEDSRKDLTKRIREGIEQARYDGFEKIFILESDDFYPADYFETFQLTPGINFIGSSKTLCYSLRFNSWTLLNHPERSSLFHTGFDLNALRKFQWPDDTTTFLDLKLWKYALQSGLPSILLDMPLAVSIKHNIGLVGGKGHRINYQNKDEDRNYLKSIVDSEAYAFYQSLKV